STWGSFVFGFDTDDLEVFDRTVEFGIQMKLTMALYAILTPYPGTQLYRRLKAEVRLTDERWWLRRDHDAGSPYFTPTRMSRHGGGVAGEREARDLAGDRAQAAAAARPLTPAKLDLPREGAGAHHHVERLLLERGVHAAGRDAHRVLLLRDESGQILRIQRRE